MKAVRQGWTIVATIAAVGALLALPAIMAGCGSAAGKEPASPSPGAAAPITARQVVDLVDATCAAIEKDAPGTLAAINAGEAPYVDPANPALYAFVFDLAVSVAANPHPEMQGQSLKGKPDAAGKLFRDEIVAGALAKGSGWEQYVYAQPGTDGLQLKTTYYKLANGSDGKQYVVGAGRYLGPWEGTPQPSPSASPVSERQVTGLVDSTGAALHKDAAATLAAIDAGEAPYTDPANPDLYAFVYDTGVTLVATPDAAVRGQSMTGKPDAAGKPFRDEIVAGALAKGSGWEQYVYKAPGKKGLFLKSTYYKLVTGSDGQRYVVCAGRYLGRAEVAPQAGSAASTAATQADVQTFVEKAVAYARMNGKDAALAAFTAPGGEFHDGELYIYAYDFDGTVIAHGGDPSLVGKNLIGMKDPNGVPVIKDLVHLAEDGSGWLYFMWGNPLNDNRVEPKLGYVMKVDDSWFLGSGTYGPAAVKPPSKAQVKAFVDEAWTYANKVGRQQAIDVFMDKGGPFFRGELYVFADQFDGTVLCFPIEPQSVGKNLWDRRDPDGVYPVREMAAVAEDPGSGWASYKYANPAQGYQMQRKLSYVRRVDDTWFLGAGTYVPAE